ncbi:phage neck terminator protein [Salibacterium sp. K-3]
MIDYANLKETLRSGIWNDLGRFFVSLENNEPRPDSQEGINTFISYKFTTPETMEESYQTHDSGIMTYHALVNMTLSLTVHSNTKDEAQTVAGGLRRWFDFHAYYYLSSHNIVIRSVESMQDRTTFLETEHTHRVGFDVILRIPDTEQYDIATIERAELNGKIIEEE